MFENARRLTDTVGGDVVAAGGKAVPPIAVTGLSAGEAVCDGAPCLSDREVGQLLDAAADAICEANDRLAWLSDYYLGTNLPPSCQARP